MKTQRTTRKLLAFSQRGVAAVELGFLLVPLITLTFGITEFGRAIYTYNTITKSARDAARFLTSKTPGDTDAHAEAKCLVAFGNPDCATPALVPGLTDLMVQTCDVVLPCSGISSTVTTGSGTINTVHVRVSGYAFAPVIEYVMPSLTFNNISVTMRSPL